MNDNNQRVHFTTSEVQYLRECVLSHKDIIENAKTDGVNLKAKESTWNVIMNEFNAISRHTPRNVKQLRKKWDNIKSRRKSELALKKREALKTGGGPSVPDCKDDPYIDGLLDVITHEIPDVIDSDYVYTDTNIINNNESQEDNEAVIILAVGERPDQLFEPPTSKGTDEESSKESTHKAVEYSKFGRKRKGPHSPSRGFSKLKKNIAVKGEIDARVSRVKKQINFDEALHNLLKQDLEIKLATSSIEYEMKMAEFEHKKFMWNLEYEAAKKNDLF